MCGRTCCTLSPDLLPYACTTVTKKKDGKRNIPQWSTNKFNSDVDAKVIDNTEKNFKYSQSTNIAPTMVTPVMFRVNSVHEFVRTNYCNQSNDILLQNMMWGLIPPWHRSDSPKGHGLTTNNARIETIQESKLYKPSLQNNQRCVVICDGFYEWKTFKDNSKQPYLIYLKQTCQKCENRENVKEETCKHTNTFKSQSAENVLQNWEDDRGWIGQKPLFMAGIYSKWNPTTYKSSEKVTQSPVFSYTVITRESGNVMKWIHHRMPLFLFNSDDVSVWLDPKISSVEALDIISRRQNENELTWYPVSPAVGSIKNQGENLMMKVELNSEGKAINKSTVKSMNMMMNWLKPANKAEKNDKRTIGVANNLPEMMSKKEEDDTEISTKKLKTEFH